MLCSEAGTAGRESGLPCVWPVMSAVPRIRLNWIVLSRSVESTVGKIVLCFGACCDVLAGRV